MGSKIVVDTNVIISGFGWDGICRKALAKALDYEWYTSYEQLLEIERVLTYPRLRNVSKGIIGFMEENCKIVSISGKTSGDDMIRETADAINAVIITGDKEFLTFPNTISVREFLEKFK